MYMIRMARGLTSDVGSKDGIRTPKVFSITPKVFSITPKVIFVSPKVILNIPRITGLLSQSTKERYLTSDIKYLSISLCYSFLIRIFVVGKSSGGCCHVTWL